MVVGLGPEDIVFQVRTSGETGGHVGALPAPNLCLVPTCLPQSRPGFPVGNTYPHSDLGNLPHFLPDREVFSELWLIFEVCDNLLWILAIVPIKEWGNINVYLWYIQVEFCVFRSPRMWRWNLDAARNAFSAIKSSHHTYKFAYVLKIRCQWSYDTY